ncbi:MAG: NAD(P)/FAD-dependent oxidoreductase [Bryobacteraceae bacterium]
MSPRSFDIVVVGAGIVGAACAREFAEAGLTVALIEADVIGGGATAAAMGHIAVMDDSEAQFALTRYSQLLWKQVAERLPADVEYLPCGAAWVAADQVEMREVSRKQRYYTERGVPVEILDPQSLAEAEPTLRPGLAGALFVKDDAVVYPLGAARFLAREAQQLGTELILGRRVISVNGNTAKLDDGTSIIYQNVVLANGIAASTFARAINIQPRKGHLVITDRYPGFARHQIIELGYLKSAHAIQADSVAFNVQPRLSGQVLIGSSRQYGITDPAVDSNVVSAMLQRAFEYMPGLSKLSLVKSWTGFRAATPDKLPLIGLCPETDNVYLATGHEGLGITTSLGTAKLLADLLLHRNSAIMKEPYLPGRSLYPTSEIEESAPK